MSDTEEWIEILRAGRVLPRGAGEVTEATLHSMVAAFTKEIPVGLGYDALTSALPAPILGCIHSLEVRRDDKGAYLAGPLRPARLPIALACGRDPKMERVEMTFSPAWIARDLDAATIVHVAVAFERLEPAPAVDASQLDAADTAPPSIVCTRDRWLQPPRQPHERPRPNEDEKCCGTAELVGIERWAIASASPRPGRDGLAVDGDRYAGPQTAHYICQVCRSRTIVELPDGTGGAVSAEKYVAALQFGFGLSGRAIFADVVREAGRASEIETLAREYDRFGGPIDLVLTDTAIDDYQPTGVTATPARRNALVVDDGDWHIHHPNLTRPQLFPSFPLVGDDIYVTSRETPTPFFMTVKSRTTGRDGSTELVGIVHPNLGNTTFAIKQARRRHVSLSFVEDGVPVTYPELRKGEKSKHGRAPRAAGPDRNARAKTKILARAGR